MILQEQDSYHRRPSFVFAARKRIGIRLRVRYTCGNNYLVYLALDPAKGNRKIVMLRLNRLLLKNEGFQGRLVWLDGVSVLDLVDF